MTLYIVSVTVLAVVIVYQGILLYKLSEQSKIERKDLIDRIQARDFNEYKHAEIRLEKVKQPKDEEKKPFEFV